ncbi:MFS transporter [Methylopila musalis]|uniref:MFS transporter n=1 Tax=Methylopila musalis TaxID=1134781 RepID=A0ABW3Z2X7_9HYPH
MGQDDGNATAADAGRARVATPILAAAAGLSVANVYYAQPLLDSMARELGVPAASAGLVVTLTQAGYGLGLIVLTPLGDLMDRRRLVLAQGALLAAALLAVATAQTAAALFAGMAAMGMLAVVVQVLVAYAATLATPAERGEAVGLVTSGVVIGILAARAVAGALADVGGWRSVYLASSVATLVMVALLARFLPRGQAPASTDRYLAALRSIPVLFLRDRVLLVRGLLASLIFAAFSAFWTALALPLSAPPFSYSHTQIGLFGLVGLAGALAARGAGRLADRGHGERTTGLSLALLLASWGIIALLPRSVAAALIGVILLDLAVQAVHVANQNVIFERRPEARSRLVGGYMTFYAAGSASGAVTATAIYARAGWPGVSALGAAFSAGALLLWAATRRAP